jgi:hypothetical protein
MGNRSLREHPQISNILFWLEENGAKSLADISSCNANERWRAWTIPAPLLKYLEGQWKDLKCKLSGSAPISKSNQDECIWGDRGIPYNVKEGYHLLLAIESDPNISQSRWRSIWEKHVSQESISSVCC